MFLVLQIPAFHVPGLTDSGFSCPWFPRPSFPRFPVPCFTDSPWFGNMFGTLEGVITPLFDANLVNVKKPNITGINAIKLVISC